MIGSWFRARWPRRSAFPLCLVLLVACGGASGITPPPPNPSALPAFPGAYGFGANAAGGRGGRVLRVTTLAPSGPGSLQAALDETGPRTIVFDVSGVIDAVAFVRHGQVTIAGQTSPGGITVRGLMIQGDSVCEADGCPLPTVAPDDFVVRFLRIRAPLGDGADGDGLRLHRARNGIVDRVSIANATDEAVQVSFSSDVTLQYLHLAETIGDHAEFGGMLLNYGDPTRGYPLTRITLHHNLWNRIVGRMPEVSFENPSLTGATIELEWSHNFLHDPGASAYFSNATSGCWEESAWRDHPVTLLLNAVGNVVNANPARSESYGLLDLACAGPPNTGYLPPTSPTRYFLADNRHSLAPALRDAQLIHCCNDFREAAASGGLAFPDGAFPFAATLRHAFPAPPATPADELRAHLLANAGAFPRDPIDRRLLASIEGFGFDAAPRDANLVGDALAFDPDPPAPPLDADGDGMSDAWERAHGLDPLGADGHVTGPLSRETTGLEGFTNLEVYLHERALALLNAARATH